VKRMEADDVEGLQVNIPAPASAPAKPNLPLGQKPHSTPQPPLSPKFQHNRAVLELCPGTGSLGLALALEFAGGARYGGMNVFNLAG